MTRQKFLKLKIEHLTDSLKSLSESKQRMLNRAMQLSHKALENAKNEEKRRTLRLDEFKANLEKACIDANLEVVQQELNELTEELISYTV